MWQFLKVQGHSVTVHDNVKDRSIYQHSSVLCLFCCAFKIYQDNK